MIKKKDRTMYDEESIKSLSPREHMQLRPGMYIGNTDTPWGLIKELLDNSIDEYAIGHVKTIEISTSDDGTVEYMDDGQGIPVNVPRDDGKTVLEAAVSVINTSGKFTDDGVYSGFSTGLHGVGLKSVNFLSDFFRIVSKNADGSKEALSYENGELRSRDAGPDIKEPRWHGISVVFRPGERYFGSNLLDLAALGDYLDRLCCLAPGISIKLNGTTITHKNGLADLIGKIAQQGSSPISDVHIVDDSSSDYKLSLAVMYTDSSECRIEGYVNYGRTEQGPHYNAVKSCMTKAINKWGKDNGLIKKGSLDAASTQEGLVCVFNLSSRGVKYDSQSKERVTSSEFVPYINDVLSRSLDQWFIDSPSDARRIVERAILAKRANDASRKAREAVKNSKAKSDKVFKVPTSVIDAWEKDRTQCELIVCEGKSAQAGLVASRDGRTQAVFGVRGKILSVLKTSPQNIIKNQEIKDLIDALGLDFNPRNGKCVYDESKLRYGKIIAAADAELKSAV